MGTTIDINGSIKELSEWRKDLNYDNGDYYYGGDTTERSLDCAIDIMHRYQKIQEIMAKRPKDMISSNPTLRAISEVLEDGKETRFS